MTTEPFRWNEDAAALSAPGRARREAILGVSRRALRGRVRRRRAAQSVGALSVVLVATGLAYVAAGPRAVPVPGPEARATPDLPSGVMRVTYVRTDPSIVSRASISDEELLGLLQASGSDAGLVRVHGRTLLTTEVPASDDTGTSRS